MPRFDRPGGRGSAHAADHGGRAARYNATKVTNATTTTTPLASPPDCPVAALDGAPEAGRHPRSGTALSVDNDEATSASPMTTTLARTVSTSRPENQGGYLEMIDKFFQSTIDDRPEIVMFVDYTTQQVIDLGTG